MESQLKHKIIEAFPEAKDEDFVWVGQSNQGSHVFGKGFFKAFWAIFSILWSIPFFLIGLHYFRSFEFDDVFRQVIFNYVHPMAFMIGPGWIAFGGMLILAAEATTCRNYRKNAIYAFDSKYIYVLANIKHTVFHKNYELLYGKQKISISNGYKVLHHKKEMGSIYFYPYGEGWLRKWQYAIFFVDDVDRIYKLLKKKSD